MSLCSVIIPAREEPYLHKTIEDVFKKAKGPIEVIAVLDGYWPEPPLDDHDNLVLIHRTESQGMRAAINSAARIAKGEYLMKIDAHCSLCEHWDEILKANCEKDWVSVPIRYKLNPETWEVYGDARKFQYIRREDLKGRDWPEYAERLRGEAICDLMTFQGSCWFMHKSHFDKIGGLDEENYGRMGKEAQEIGLKTWLSGGRVILNRNAWYGHWDKDRGLYGDMKAEKEKSTAFALDFWLNDRWPLATRKFRWLIDKFSPVPGWREIVEENREVYPGKMFIQETSTDDLVLYGPEYLNGLIMRTFEVNNVAPPDPVFIPGKGRADLWRFCADAGFKRGAEIGVFSGRNAQAILRAMPDLHLTLVDHYQMEDMEFAGRCEDRARRRAKGQNVQWLKMDSERAAFEIPDGSLDFVHLDARGDYDGYMQDLIMWQRKVRKGGIVSGMGYTLKPHCQILYAVDDYARVHNINPWFVMRGIDRNPSWFYVKTVDQWPVGREMSYATV